MGATLVALACGFGAFCVASVATLMALHVLFAPIPNGGN